MENFIAQTLNRFERGTINRRQLITTISAAAATLRAASGFAQAPEGAAPARQRPEPTAAQKQHNMQLQDDRTVAPFKATQVGHFRYTCKDYKPARDFYQKVMGWHLVPGSDTGEQCKLAFYPKGITPIGQAKGTPSGYVVMRNGWTAPTPPAAGSTTPHVVINHIAYTVQFDKPLPNGKVTWDTGTQGQKDGPLETMRGLLTDNKIPGIRQDHDTSFHVTDPNGYDLQISGVGMDGYTP